MKLSDRDKRIVRMALIRAIADVKNDVGQMQGTDLEMIGDLENEIDDYQALLTRIPDDGYSI
jgi:hypothetical protein